MMLMTTALPKRKTPAWLGAGAIRSVANTNMQVELHNGNDTAPGSGSQSAG
jgi:hypothetical protein